MDGRISSPCLVEYGVSLPQGSILRPLFFLLVNDLPRATNFETILLLMTPIYIYVTAILMRYVPEFNAKL